MKQFIKPTILKGTRDFLPAEMARRNAVMDRLRAIFERFGYAPIETPILNPAETILGKYGEEGDRLTYSFEDNGGRRVALPYDLTVPFARFVATNYGELPMPFKRYQIQRVWRAEKPQKGRLREFYQCDIDVIGTRSLVVEAEVARVIAEVFGTLKIDYRITVNSRRLMNTVLAAYQISEEARLPVIRALDKLAKTGEAAVAEELRALGVARAEDLLRELAPEKDNARTLEKLSAYDTGELRSFLAYAEGMGTPPDRLVVTPSLARGLDYYTGIIYEVVSPSSDFGTICAGGRYDDLGSLFLGRDLSGIGVAFGFERIMLVLEEQGALADVKAGVQALVALFDEATMSDAVAVYRDLITAGVSAEIYFEPAKLAKQFKYADAKGIPFVAVAGPEEIAAGTVNVKNMRTGKQKQVPRGQLSAYFFGYHDR